MECTTAEAANAPIDKCGYLYRNQAETFNCLKLNVQINYKKVI